jgi:hypothetical protein
VIEIVEDQPVQGLVVRREDHKKKRVKEGCDEKGRGNEVLGCNLRFSSPLPFHRG